MLTKNIANILHFLQSKKVNIEDPPKAVLKCFEGQEVFSKANFMIYDFERNSLYYINPGAANFLGIEQDSAEKFHGSALETIVHPCSHQLMYLVGRNFSQHPHGTFSNVYYIKTGSKAKYNWIYASGKVVSVNRNGLPKLIYVCFVEVEKALQYYLKMLNSCAAENKGEAPLLLLNSLKHREIEILSLICAEYTSKEIANKLNMTQAAVDAARKRLIQKLGVKSVAGLVKISIALGLNQTERNSDWIDMVAPPSKSVTTGHRQHRFVTEA
jgi:DNA-binding CsgD family transcriptional regulator